jgi:hypothetical protein
MQKNEDKLLIQVVPRLTPTHCGVSDHAIALAHELKSSFGIETAFVIVNSDERCEGVPYREAYCGASELLAACSLLGGNRRTSVLVHVSGYGYSDDGAPKALADALVKLHDSGRFLIAAYFHELYADGAPWTSAFWYSRSQKRELARIAKTCSLVVTNTSHHASWLREQTSATLRVMPVFSNIGECETLVPWNERKPALVIYGQSGTREKSYRELQSLGSLIEALNISEIIDVGADANVPSAIGKLQVRRMGRLSSDQVCDLLSSVQFGFAWHPPRHIAKSGVFASLCAFGVVPVLATAFTGEVDGLRDGLQLISATALKGNFAACSKSAWEWYRIHSRHAHAHMYADWIAAEIRNRSFGAGAV